jgi:hypothetical protein
MKNNHKKKYALILITVMAFLVWHGSCMETPKDQSSNDLASQLSGLLRRIGQLLYLGNPPILPSSSSLATLYEQYNNNGNLPINAPKELEVLYEKHKAYLDESLTQGSFNLASETKMIEEFINNGELFYDNNALFINNLLPDSSDYKDCIAIPPKNKGYSGAEILIIKEKTGKNVLGVVKIFVCPTQNDLTNRCRELSASLIALGLNPDPEKIKMVRIQAAGYQTTNASHRFGILMEHAAGESIKDIVQQCLKGTDSFGFANILRHTAKYLAFFHENSSMKFNKKQHNLTAERRNRKSKFYSKIGFLIGQIGDTKNGFFNFQEGIPSKIQGRRLNFDY